MNLYREKKTRAVQSSSKPKQKFSWFGFMVFNATFTNISVKSCRSVLLVAETGVPVENHRPVASH